MSTTGSSNDELIDSYLNRDGIKSDTAFLEAELSKAAALFDKVNSKKVTIQGQKTMSGVAESSELGFKANARLEQSVKAVIAVINNRFAAEAKLVTVSSDYARETIKTNLEIQKQTQSIKLQAQEQQSLAGSIDNMRAKVALLNKERNAESTFTEQGRANIEKLNNQINKYNDAIKKSGDELTKQKINIGNYTGAVTILKSSLGEIAKKIDDNTKSGKGNKDVLNALQKEYNILNQLVNSQAAGFANATQEIRANQKALFSLEEAGLKASEGYKNLAKETGKLQDSLGDIRARTKALGSDTFALDGLIQGAQALAGAYGVAQGAAALFGADNKELEKTFVKLQAIMTVIQGLQAVQNALQSETALVQGAIILKEKIYTGLLAVKEFILKGITAATVINTTVTEGQTIAQNASTAATNRGSIALVGLRAALILSGIGVILLLLVAAAAAMGAFSDNTIDATKQIDALADSFDKAESTLNSLNDTLEFNGKIALERLKQRGASEEELHKQVIDNIKIVEYATFQAYRKEQEGIDKIRASTLKNIKELNEAKKQAFEGTRFQGSNAEIDQQSVKAAKELNDKLEVQQKRADALKATALALGRSSIEQEEIFKTKKAEDGRKAGEDAAKKDEDKKKQARDKAIKAAQEYAKSEAAAQYEIIKLAIEDRKVLAKRIVDNEKSDYAVRLNALTDFSKASQELINAENNKTQNDPKKTKGEKELSEKKAVIATRDLKIDAEKQLMDIVDANFQKRKDQQQIEYAEYQKIQEQKRQLIQDGIANKVGQEELSLRNRFEIESAGKSADERLKLEEKLNKDIQRLREVATQAELIRTEQELAAKRAIMKLFGLDTSSVDKLITENEIEQSKERIKNAKSEADKKKAIREQGIDLFLQIETEAAGILSALVEGQNTREKNKNADLLDGIEKQKNAEIEGVNASILSNEEKAAKITVINAVAQAKKEEIEQRNRRLDIQRAKFERDLGILQIIVQIGVALAKGRYDSAALAGASLIKALATPIPRFKDGKGPANNYEGPALVNDGGKVEPILRSGSGKVEISNVMNRITHVSKDDIVFSSIEDMLSKMAMPNLRSVNNNFDINADMRNDIKQQNKLLKEIANKPGLQIAAGDSGMAAVWKHAANRVQYINQNTNWNT